MRERARAARLLIIGLIIGANMIGAAIVVILLGFVLPIPAEGEKLVGVGGVLVWGGVIYAALAVILGLAAGRQLARPVISFFESGREPSAADRRAVLMLPLMLLKLQVALWGGAALLFGAIAVIESSALFGFEVAITNVIAGFATACIAYLYTQRLIRAGVDVVLADAPPRRREVPGVAARALLVWGLGAAPLAGILTLALFAGHAGMTLGSLARATAVLALVTLAVGLMATLAFARSLSDPLQRLQDAVTDVGEGDFDVAVPVFDATEVGYASASFNRMAAGLAERERLRDLFGRQVGSDVARRALEEGVTLGGEEREAAALFIDIIDSTGFAADRPPSEVVNALNGFFTTVVEVTTDNGGLVNKFIGDAALCVFGAPLDQEDPEGAALAAAREMAERLRGGPLDAGIGVASGTVVAGNVGSEDRYEYTVIGDPVNEAARLTELAKDRPGRVLAAGAAVDGASAEEAERWKAAESVTLRGRSTETRLAVPAGPA